MVSWEYNSIYGVDVTNQNPLGLSDCMGFSSIACVLGKVTGLIGMFSILLCISHVVHAGSNVSISIGLNNHVGYGYGYHKLYPYYSHKGYYGHGTYRSRKYYKSHHGHYRRLYPAYHQGGGKYYSSGDLAAALVIGGAIGYGMHYYQKSRRNYHSYLTSYGHSVHYAGSSRPVAIGASNTAQPAVNAAGSGIPARRLLKDLDGNCFEIHRNQLGDELRIQLQSWECNW